MPPIPIATVPAKPWQKLLQSESQTSSNWISSNNQIVSNEQRPKPGDIGFYQNGCLYSISFIPRKLDSTASYSILAIERLWALNTCDRFGISDSLLVHGWQQDLFRTGHGRKDRVTPLRITGSRAWASAHFHGTRQKHREQVGHLLFFVGSKVVRNARGNMYHLLAPYCRVHISYVLKQ